MMGFDQDDAGRKCPPPGCCRAAEAFPIRCVIFSFVLEVINRIGNGWGACGNKRLGAGGTKPEELNFSAVKRIKTVASLILIR